MKLKELIFGAFPGLTDCPGLPDLEVAGIECDSRAVRKNFVFIAIQGVKKDGNQFIDEALSRGAAAVVADVKPRAPREIPVVLVPDARAAAGRLASFFYGDPSEKMRMIGITGTNGKTTSSYILEHLLSSEGKRSGVIGTVNYRFGRDEIPATETTPGPLKIQSVLSRMRSGGCEYVVMEASSHALEQKRVEGIRFCAALFTNLTQDHLDYHRTMEKYFESKSRLFSGLGEDGFAVLNADDEGSRKLRPLTRAGVLTYGVSRPADLKAENIAFGADSTSWELWHGGRSVKIFSPLIGLHNVYNVLGSIAVLTALGFPPERVAVHLKSFAGVPGRLEAVNAGQDFKVFVDFAHTPDGLLNVLKALQAYRKKKLLLVFGCGGDRDRDKRPRMACIAAQLCDRVFVTSDNPRNEDPEAIVREICSGFPPDFNHYTVVIDRKTAIRRAFLSAAQGDIVLLAGKGHEKTQVIGNQALPFSDRQEAERVLRGY